MKWMAIVLLGLVSACDQQNRYVTSSPAAVEPVVETTAAVAVPTTVSPVAGTTVATLPARSSTDQGAGHAAAVSGREQALALAQASGCLACHRIETRIVGPAWQDVSIRYQGDSGARARLVAKVKSGGKGNWTAVTGGVGMPPYSPRVADQDIKTLVKFILSL